MQKLVLLSLLCLMFVLSAKAQRQMEYLNRGVVAVHQCNDSVYVGWRMLGTEPENITFNLYRSTGNNAAVKLNAAPITATTDYVDTKVDLDHINAYHVRPIINGKELQGSEVFKLPANAKRSLT